ncbi:MAG: hypothetical protein KAI79_06580 [Bacteroidales bacterium]|nr:hypothetical protein [Bacteroidales bacterium]
MNIKNFILLILLLSPFISKAQESKSIIEKSAISGQWFINYNWNNTDDFGKFQLKRGYFTFKTELNESLSVRYTQDITLDTEGDDEGNIEIRMKYLYLKWAAKDLGFLTKNKFEFGMVHRPWLSFDEGINNYRIQSKLFAESSKLIASADLGISFMANLGPSLDKDVIKKIGEKFPGRYGSIAFGVYNGGGYHAIELNDNKTVEGRLTLRPFAELIPGLQVSYTFAYGKANLVENTTPVEFNLVMLSYKSAYYIGSVQYSFGKGNISGSFTNPIDGSAYSSEGISAFSEFKIPNSKIALFGRYDYFDSFQSPTVNTYKYFGGIAYRFLKSKLVLGFNEQHSESGVKSTAELALEIKF